MAKEDPQVLCERLFATFLSPLVTGGSIVPGKPFGGKQALAFGSERGSTNTDLASRTELARVRIARKLAPIDTLSPAPTREEWALAAVLHDLVQATHPDLDAVFRKKGPGRILDVADATLARIAPPVNVGDALSRHTWFSRMFTLTRTDIDVRWWSGSQRFLGTEPPKRLYMWRERRRVTETRYPRALMDLPTAGAAVDVDRFARTTTTFLQKTPLTDLATLTRSAPTFVWTHENLSLSATRSGRAMIHRAFALLDASDVDRVLGRATRQLFAQKAVRAVLVATPLLRDRALGAATMRLAKDTREPLGAEDDDESFALGIGALAASHWLTHANAGFAEAERRSLLEIFAPAANAVATPELRALLG